MSDKTFLDELLDRGLVRMRFVAEDMKTDDKGRVYSWPCRVSGAEMRQDDEEKRPTLNEPR